MKVIFTGDPIELERGESLSRLSTAMYGITFPMSAEVDVSHLSEVQKRKLANNKHFRVVGVDAEPTPRLYIPQGVMTAVPVSAAGQAEAASADDEAAAAVELAERLKSAPPKQTKPRK